MLMSSSLPSPCPCHKLTDPSFQVIPVQAAASASSYCRCYCQDCIAAGRHLHVQHGVVVTGWPWPFLSSTHVVGLYNPAPSTLCFTHSICCAGTGVTACMHLAEAFVHSSCTLLLRRLLRKSVSGQGLACTATSTLYVAGRQYTVSVGKGGGGSVQPCSTSPTGGAGEDMTSARRNASLTADKIAIVQARWTSA